MLALGAGGREFESLIQDHVTVVQGIEQQPSKLWVAGSIPAGHAKGKYV